MPIKTILVSLNDIERAKELLKISSVIARRHDAHIIGLYVIPAVYVYPGISVHEDAGVSDWGKRFFQERADDVKKLFNDEMDKQGFKGECRQIDGDSYLVSNSVIEHGRQANLIVVGQGGVDSNNGCEVDFAERVVFDSGRPVILVPRFGSFDTLAENVIFAWNASREAARASFDAIPLLSETSSARIVWVNSTLRDENQTVLPGAELTTALSRHDIEAVSEPITTTEVDAADALLNRVSDTGADLLVMGAYGHSRVREFVFGGATRKILDHMTVPVLMSH